MLRSVPAPLGFDNTFALVVRSNAEEVRTVSDLAKHPGEWRAGFGYELKERAEGYPGAGTHLRARVRGDPDHGPGVDVPGAGRSAGGRGGGERDGWADREPEAQGAGG